MLRGFKISPFLQDFAATAVVSVITGASAILVTRLLARGVGPEGFGAYSLSRRILATVTPFSTFATGVAVARYVAMARDEAAKVQYLLAGVLLGVLPSLCVLVLGLTFADSLSLLISMTKPIGL